MSFLDKLKNTIADEFASQLNVGENKNTSLNLGDFGKNVDKSAQRTYLEEGVLRKDLFSQKSKQLEILMQEPQVTVLLKKKMFSSLANNNQLEYMSNDEKLYYKASKTLFKNKCEQISNYERLSKISKILEVDSSYTSQILPIIISIVEKISEEPLDVTSNLFSNKKPSGLSSLANVLEKVKTVLATSEPNKYTTWITKDFTKTDYFDGTGSIEFTNVSSLNTNVSLSRTDSSFEISDPYKITYITEYDIERAIADATNSFNNKKIFNFSLNQTEALLNDLNSRLKKLRLARGVGQLSFHVNADTILSKRVRVINDRIGVEFLFEYDSTKALSNLLTLNTDSSAVKITNEYLINGLFEAEGLDTNPSENYINDTFFKKESELSLLKKIISVLYTKIALEQNSKNSLQILNKQTNYARNKMRFSFLGKNIIQSMDEVSIFISSKSKYDNKVLSGVKSSFSGLNTIQKFSSTIYDIKNQFQSIADPSSNLDLESEKAVFVGSDFPSRIWSFLRNLFISDKDGACCFSGVVRSAKLGYSDGSYNVSVNVADKTYYLTQGKVNFNPGADNFNGAIFDPLTPFKTKFDEVNTNFKNEIPELLDENKAIIGDGASKKGLLKFKAGPGIGELATDTNIVSDVTINSRTGRKERYLYGPDGLVYNWKQGIGVYVAYGNSIDINDPNKVGAQTGFKNPFAGQDVMNVISLLVTGTPYNFINYWKNIQSLEGFKKDFQTNQNSSYFLTLANELKKSNSVFGNFVPFKNLVLDEQAYAKLLSTQFSIDSNIQELNDKLQRLTDIDSKLSIISSIDSKVNSSSEIDARSKIATQQKEELIKDINSLKEQIYVSDSLTNELSIVGNDVIFDSDQFINQGDPNQSLRDKSVRRNLRRRLNYLTRRLAWAVRANEDKNLFIVDDTYDKDYDILAFEKSLKENMELYNNEFLDPYSKIESVTNLLNLEFFADSQGHIRVRSPQYNKIPSSVFYRLTELKNQYGINIYPQFLDNLFTNQLDAIKDKIEVLEDQLRLACLFIGLNDDSEIGNFISNTSKDNAYFNFLTSESGSLINYDLIKTQTDPDVFETVGALVEQQNATSNKSYFTPASRADVILKFLSPDERSKYQDLVIDQARLDQIALRILNKTGQKPDYKKYVDTIETGYTKIQSRSANLFTVTEDIAITLSERARTVKLFYEAIKNSVESKQIDNPNVQAGLLTPRTSMNSIPEALDHLIEDESYDEYGPGSGSRYVIKNSQIISYSLGENDPEYTAVQVNGTIDETFDVTAASDLTNAINSNQGLSSAFAIDYSLWRDYGLKQPSSINLPFLKEPQAQLAPYASMLLAKARKNILKGSVSLIGNEYYQVGDVVYFEEVGLLYYVTNVSHSFSYSGRSFTTSLTLEYGHVPGDYIPNVTDLIGKVYYSNKDLADNINYRQVNSFNETNIGIIVYDEQAYSAIDLGEGQYKNKYADLNSKTIRDILNTVGYQFAINNVKNSKIKASVELRIYYDSNFGSPPEGLLNLREDVYQILSGMKKIPEDSSFGKLDFSIDKEWIIKDDTVNINQSSEDPRSPSNRAISMVRDMANSSNGIATEQQQIDDIFEDAFKNSKSNFDKVYSGIAKNLYKYIIDCFVKFTFEDEINVENI